MATETKPAAPPEFMQRLMQALSPALQAEIDRAVLDTRQSLEADFAKRLKEQLGAAESAAAARTKAELDDLRQKLTAELQGQHQKDLQAKLDEVRTKLTAEKDAAQAAALAALAAESKKSTDASTAERASLAASRDALQAEVARLTSDAATWKTLADGQRQMDTATSQPDILLKFMKTTEPLAPVLALYIVKGDGLSLWKSRGDKKKFPDVISAQTADPAFFFKSVDVRGKAVAAVYAGPEANREALEFLAAAMESAIEVYGLKLRNPAKA